jgi:D-beta-D-heptose 7-phosphate kinase/D-beta-D-heptose 1-phosphate adenosyltransferase
MWDTLHAKVPELEAVECLVVGDRDRDIAFGKSIGCETAHILSREYPLTREATYAVRTLGELADILLPAKGKIVSLDEAIRLAGEARQRQQTIVTTNGAFDLFHEGHRFLLRTARSSGDILIVGVNSDSSIRRSKGPGRPVQSQDQRAHVIARQADVVFVFDDDDPRAWLRHIRPHVHLNAVTYGERCVERPVLDEIGATLILVPVKKELGSTTEIMSHFPPVV